MNLVGEEETFDTHGLCVVWRCKVPWPGIGIVHMKGRFQHNGVPPMFAFFIGCDFFGGMFGGSSIYRLYLSFWKYRYACLVLCGFLSYQQETLRRTPNPSSV